MKFNRFTGFLIGGGLGAAVTLLFAPKSGKATRRYLSHRMDDGKEVMERGVAGVQDFYRGAQHSADRTFNRMRKAVAM